MNRLLILLIIIIISHSAHAGDNIQNGDMESSANWIATSPHSFAERRTDIVGHGGSSGSFILTITDADLNGFPDGTDGEIRATKTFQTLCDVDYTLTGWFYAHTFKSKSGEDAEILIILYRGNEISDRHPSAIGRILEKDVVFNDWTKIQIGPFKDNYCGATATVGLFMNVGKVEEWESIPVIYWDDISVIP